MNALCSQCQREAAFSCNCIGTLQLFCQNCLNTHAIPGKSHSIGVIGRNSEEARVGGSLQEYGDKLRRLIEAVEAQAREVNTLEKLQS